MDGESVVHSDPRFINPINRLEAADHLAVALKLRVARTEQCDNVGDYGVSSDDPAMQAARSALEVWKNAQE